MGQRLRTGEPRRPRRKVQRIVTAVTTSTSRAYSTRVRHDDPVADIDAVLRALAESGVWHGSNDGDAELVRVEIRRAARKARINVRTTVDGLGRPHACTPDGWPAHEPWRGAAIHAHESGAEDAVTADALDRILNKLYGE